MKKTKRIFALLVSLALALTLSVAAFAEGETKPSLGSTGSDFGQGLTDLIGNFGGDADFDFSGLFGGIGELGDIDIGSFLSDINLDSLKEDLSGLLGNITGSGNGIGGNLDIGSLLDDIGSGDLVAMLQEGLGSILGIGGETGGGEGESGSGGLTDIISGAAGSIADITGNFDIKEFLGGLIGGSNSGSTGGTGNPQIPTTAPAIPDTTPGTGTVTPPVIIGGGSNTGGSAVTIPPEVTEYTTREFTTIRRVLQAVDTTNPDIPEKEEGRNTNKVVAGIILVLGSFGAVAYIVVKKVI